MSNTAYERACVCVRVLSAAAEGMLIQEEKEGGSTTAFVRYLRIHIRIAVLTLGSAVLTERIYLLCLFSGFVVVGIELK